MNKHYYRAYYVNGEFSLAQGNSEKEARERAVEALALLKQPIPDTADELLNGWGI